jgi:hypothetical protein
VVPGRCRALPIKDRANSAFLEMDSRIPADSIAEESVNGRKADLSLTALQAIFLLIFSSQDNRMIKKYA